MKISEQIIDLILLRGSNFEEGKLRIYKHFKNNPKSDGKEFLKDEYGLGGSSFSFLDNTTLCSENHSSKGLEINTSEDKLLLSWGEVAKKILNLLQQDRYFSPQEKNLYNIHDTKDIVVDLNMQDTKDVIDDLKNNVLDTWTNSTESKGKIEEGQLCLF